MITTRIVCAALALAPAIAHAEPHTASGDADLGAPSRLSLTLGLATPTGEIGAEYALVFRHFEVGAGLGFGIFGPQASVMPRLRLGDPDASFTLGAGLSGGPYEAPSLCFTTGDNKCMGSSGDVVWANLEAGGAWTWSGGTTFRLYGGVGRRLDDSNCGGTQCRTLHLPYLGVAIGHTL